MTSSSSFAVNHSATRAWWGSSGTKRANQTPVSRKIMTGHRTARQLMVSAAKRIAGVLVRHGVDPGQCLPISLPLLLGHRIFGCFGLDAHGDRYFSAIRQSKGVMRDDNAIFNVTVEDHTTIIHYLRECPNETRPIGLGDCVPDNHAGQTHDKPVSQLSAWRCRDVGDTHLRLNFAGIVHTSWAKVGAPKMVAPPVRSSEHAHFLQQPQFAVLRRPCPSSLDFRVEDGCPHRFMPHGFMQDVLRFWVAAAHWNPILLVFQNISGLALECFANRFQS